MVTTGCFLDGDENDGSWAWIKKQKSKLTAHLFFLFSLRERQLWGLSCPKACRDCQNRHEEAEVSHVIKFLHSAAVFPESHIYDKKITVAPHTP